MQEIRFLKKHIIILTLIVVTVLGAYLYGQFGILSKKYDTRNELKDEIKQEQVTKLSLNKRKKELEAMTELKKSKEIKGFTLSDKIASELTEIEKKIDTSNVTIRGLEMEEEDYFKDEKISNETIKRKVVTMDVEAASDKDLEKFVKEIQSNKNRTTKIKSIDYKASSGLENKNTAATVIFYMYYIQMEEQ